MTQPIPRSQSLELSDAPPTCRTTYYPPPGLDRVTITALNALPSSQPAPPPALAAVTGNLAGHHVVTCSAATPGPGAPLSSERPPVAGAWFDGPSPRPE